MSMLNLNSGRVGIVSDCKAMKEWSNHGYKVGYCQIHTFTGVVDCMFMWVLLRSKWVDG